MKRTSHGQSRKSAALLGSASLLIALGTVLAGSLGATPAHAAWKQYTYTELGVAKDFPAEPTMAKGVYKAPLAKEAPSIIYSVVKDGIVYKLTVVDFAARAAEGANLLIEAAREQTQGKGNSFRLEDFPLYDKGSNSVYGTMLTLDKADGEHSMAVFFFNKGRLYIVQSVVPPKNPNRQTPDLARFMDTTVFHLAGYGFDYSIGHDYPLGDDRPENRDRKVIPGYTPPPGLVSGPIKDGPPA